MVTAIYKIIWLILYYYIGYFAGGFEERNYIIFGRKNKVRHAYSESRMVEYCTNN